ncbi:hypothetical protein L210DRAFT_2714108 [Boletus edulis BED1]|uniref:Uncharacterized protein n=1 Tax=Boletus edulis BED1 TaxID=1328754 RepID=A0AAD4GBC9_BOLED|nr:hypothetical protein L210DRAFT_2714108 [Boletus edulis BED1]
MSQPESDDRAAMAARAKAMLKKRQRTAVAGSRTTSLASPPPSRSSTPAPAKPAAPAEEGKRERDINDLPNDTDTNWIETLPRAEVPDASVVAHPQSQRPRPSPRSPPPPERLGAPASVSQSVTTPVANQQALDDLHNRLAEQRHIITSLQAENSTLQTSLPRLDEIQADARDKAKALQESRARSKALEDELAQARESHVVATRHHEELSREKSRLEDLHAVAQTKIGGLETSRLEYDQILREANQNVDSLQSDIKRLAADLGSAQQEVRSSRAHSTKVEQELSAARGQIDSLRTSAIVDSKRWQEQDQSRQQTISLLVSEKASLIASVQRSDEVEMELQEKEKSFLAEQAKAAHLAEKVQDLEITTRRQGNELGETLSREKELLERVKDRDREIQLRKAELEEVQATSSQHQQRVRELEEQIESDDRADKLEISLKNTQDRADELEFQLNKIQQAHTSIKSERDSLGSQLRSKTESEADWMARHSSLEVDHAALKGGVQSKCSQATPAKTRRARFRSDFQRQGAPECPRRTTCCSSSRGGVREDAEGFTRRRDEAHAIFGGYETQDCRANIRQT